MSPRTIALAVLCVAVLAFAAATLDSTTNPETSFGAGYAGVDEDLGGDRTPTDRPAGDSEDDRESVLALDTEAGSPFRLCQPWLTRSLVQALLVLGLLGVFAAGRWLDDAATGLASVFVVGYPGFFLYLLFTSCNSAQPGLLELSDGGRPAAEGGGLLGGASATAPTAVSLSTKLLLVLVAGTLLVVAALVLTGNHDQTDRATDDDPDDESESEPATNVRAVGAAAGRAADRIEETDEFENEVHRAWAAMTDHLAVDHPESSTPAEFATAATVAGMDTSDVDRLTALFEEVRYGGADPTAERERAAVETLRRIEAAYADGANDSDDGPDSGSGSGSGSGSDWGVGPDA